MEIGERGVLPESKWATVYHRTGVGVRRTENVRWLIALGIVVILFAGIYLFHRSSRSIAVLGLPLALVLIVGIFQRVKAMCARADETGNPDPDAGDETAAEEDADSRFCNLPEGYFVARDFGSKRGNIDYVVISTKGIHTVGTVRRKGIVSCAGDVLQLDGMPLEKDYIKQACAQALCLRDHLLSHGISPPKPQPVLLFVDADVQVRRPVRGVEIVGRRYFPVYLKRLQNRLDPNEAERIFEMLRSSESQMFV